MADDQVIPGEQFHAERRPFYAEQIDWAVFKRADLMAQVSYDPNHRNENETGDRAGHGRTIARWVFCGRDSDGEGLFSTPLHLVIDSRLDPGASIGLHAHLDTEEFYYVLEGRLTVTTVAADGREATADLEPGDAHAVLLGQSHTCVAGPEGARFLGVSLRPANS
jgi:quercetin dioxygenase-like cupin family protein